jgi:hypothetical protein
MPLTAAEEFVPHDCRHYSGISLAQHVGETPTWRMPVGPTTYRLRTKGGNKRQRSAHNVCLALRQHFALGLLKGRRPQRVEDAVGVDADWAAAAAAAAAADWAAAAAAAGWAAAAAAGWAAATGLGSGSGTLPRGDRACLMQRAAIAASVHAGSGEQDQQHRHC